MLIASAAFCILMFSLVAAVIGLFDLFIMVKFGSNGAVICNVLVLFFWINVVFGCSIVGVRFSM